MKKTDVFWNLLFPPSCIACEERMDFRSSEALCPLCRSRFEIEKGYSCPECNRPHSECTCTPPRMKRYSDQALHLVEYTSDESVARALVLSAKDNRYEYLYRFLTDQLAALLRKHLGAELSDFSITYVPRSRRKAARYGVDQAEEVARRLSQTLSLALIKVFAHADTGQQKTLSAKERLENVRSSYRCVTRESLKGRSVILYDDVVTSGATLAICASLLKKAGVSRIVYLSFGKTYKKWDSKQKSGSLPRNKKRYYVSKKTLV